MTSANLEGIKAIISVDLGSTYSGYGWSLTENSEIHVKEWDAEKGKKLKAPTKLLYQQDEKKTKLFFGFEAEGRCKNGDELDVYFKKKHNEAKVLKFTTKHDMQLNRDLYADLFSYFKKNCFEEIKDAEGIDLTKQDVLWVFSMPIVWNMKEKEFLIAAACQADLIAELKSTNIMVIKEATASYEFVRSLEDPGEFKRKSNGEWYTTDEIKSLKKQKGYVVADIGGRSLDITVKISDQSNEGNEKDTITHTKPKGAALGGHNINTDFETLFALIFSPNFISYCKKDKAATWNTFIDEVDTQKQHHPVGTDNAFTTSVIKNFFDTYDEWAKANKRTLLEDVFKKLNKGEIKKNELVGVMYNERKSRIELSKSRYQSLLDQTVNPIVDAIYQNIEDVAKDSTSCKITAVYLTGGFASSEYLQKSLEAKLANCDPKVILVVPKNPDECVIKGAILYSKNQFLVHAGNSDANYSLMLNSESEEYSRPIFLSCNQQLLHGTIYEKMIKGKDLHDPEVLVICRNDKVLLAIPLSPLETYDKDKNLTVSFQIHHETVTVNVTVNETSECLSRDLSIKYIMDQEKKERRQAEEKRQADGNRKENAQGNVKQEEKNSNNICALM